MFFISCFQGTEHEVFHLLTYAINPYNKNKQIVLPNRFKNYREYLSMRSQIRENKNGELSKISRYTKRETTQHFLDCKSKG